MDSDLKPENRGAQRLQELFPGRGGQAKCSAEVGVKLGVVSRWMRSERKPSPEQRARLEDLYSIGWRAWDEPAVVPEPAKSEPRNVHEPKSEAS